MVMLTKSFIAKSISIFGLILTVQCNPTTINGQARNDEAIIQANGASPPEKYESVAYCDPYCDMYGYYQPGKWCVGEDSSVDVYCCGNEFSRFCCDDSTKDIADMFPPAKSCPNSSWWYYQWKVIVGLLSTLVVMLLLAACCYYCCGGTRVHYGSRGNLFSIGRRANTDEEVPPTEDPTFDPESPYAFRPPDYSLPKDPPKYSDIVNGIDNSAFDSGESNTQPERDNLPSSNSTNNMHPVEETSVEPSVIAETPPPVYEEIDSNSQELVSGNEGINPVHVHVRQPTTSDRTATVITGSNSSLTGLGASHHSTETLTSVENSPLPYQKNADVTNKQGNDGNDSSAQTESTDDQL